MAYSPILNGGPLILRVLYANERCAEDEVEQGESETDTVDSQYTVTFVPCAVHLDVVVAVLLYEFDGPVGLHEPC